MSQNITPQGNLAQALQWHLDNGADDLWLDAPIDRTAIPELPKRSDAAVSSPSLMPNTAAKPAKARSTNNVLGFQDNAAQEGVSDDMMGAAQAIIEAQKLAAACDTLEDLEQAIKDFNGLSIRKTASKLVFADGNPQSDIMVIGEAPGAEEDVEGKPFVGASGQLLDKILACVGLSRTDEDMSKSVYLSNLLNWRPPGNRTPTQAEVDISLPFLERHIALAQPKALILCGGVSAKALLRRSDTISKLRGVLHDYPGSDSPLNGAFPPIPALVTYHPAYLLSTPAQKKAVWDDMLLFQAKYLTKSKV